MIQMMRHHELVQTNVTGVNKRIHIILIIKSNINQQLALVLILFSYGHISKPTDVCMPKNPFHEAVVKTCVMLVYLAKTTVVYYHIDHILHLK